MTGGLMILLELNNNKLINLIHLYFFIFLKNETIETINVNLIIHTIIMISSVNYNPKFLKLRKWIQIDKVLFA
jgi:hypothetical protein